MQKFILLFFMLFATCFTKAAIINNNNIGYPISIIKKENPINYVQLLAKMPIAQIEKQLGRKLKFKEKLAIKIIKFNAKQEQKKRDNPKSKRGKTSLTLGILAIVTLIIFPLATIPLGIIAITEGNAAKKENPNDSDAKTGKTLGIVALGLVALVLLALLLVLFALSGFWVY